MPKQEGNAHGKHHTEDEREDDAQRNHNQSKGRDHFPASADVKAGGHSDKHASSQSDTGGEQHEFRHKHNEEEASHPHDKAQDEGHMTGTGRNEGGHEGGRHQHN